MLQECDCTSCSRSTAVTESDRSLSRNILMILKELKNPIKYNKVTVKSPQRDADALRVPAGELGEYQRNIPTLLHWVFSVLDAT